VSALVLLGSACVTVTLSLAIADVSVAVLDGVLLSSVACSSESTSKNDYIRCNALRMGSSSHLYSGRKNDVCIIISNSQGQIVRALTIQ
jgi:hypothetical protein